MPSHEAAPRPPEQMPRTGGGRRAVSRERRRPPVVTDWKGLPERVRPRPPCPAAGAEGRLRPRGDALAPRLTFFRPSPASAARVGCSAPTTPRVSGRRPSSGLGSPGPRPRPRPSRARHPLLLTACVCTYDGRRFRPGDVIYHTTDGTGGCISARCSANGTIDRRVYPCSPTTPTPPTTFSFSTPPLGKAGPPLVPGIREGTGGRTLVISAARKGPLVQRAGRDRRPQLCRRGRGPWHGVGL